MSTRSISRICSQCNKYRDDEDFWGKSKICRDCRRENFNTQKRLRGKITAKMELAIRRGMLPPIGERMCEICGRQASHYHHPYRYSVTHALDVIPLCIPCHSKEHKQKKEKESAVSA